MSHNLQPTPLQFGNRQVAASTARRFMAFGYSRVSATTNFGIPAFTSAPRRVRRIKVRQATGRGNGKKIRYTLVVNGEDTDLFVEVASTFSGVESKELEMDKTIHIPPDAQIDIAVDKPEGGIQRSPLDCTVTVELL